jgi:hypothetical protein
MKRHLAFCFILALPVFTLQAQTAVEIEALLSAGALNYGQAASFVLRAADVQAAGAPFDYAFEQNWLSARAAPDGAAALNEVSRLIMGAFGMKGGLMYSLTKSPHYAYRELVYQGIIQGRSDPNLAVSGDLLLFMIGRVLDRIEGDTIEGDTIEGDNP